jgi:hypothetical protein
VRMPGMFSFFPSSKASNVLNSSHCSLSIFTVLRKKNSHGVSEAVTLSPLNYRDLLAPEHLG